MGEDRLGNQVCEALDRSYPLGGSDMNDQLTDGAVIDCVMDVIGERGLLVDVKVDVDHVAMPDRAFGFGNAVIAVELDRVYEDLRHSPV